MADQADIDLVLSKTKLYRNHPVPNQLFLDIFPLFRCPTVAERVVAHLTAYILRTYPSLHNRIAAIVCLEARGFFFAPVIASRLGLPCIPVRKKGKLPGEVVGVRYEKDYGVDEFEMSGDAFEGVELGQGREVLLIDDLLGKGGSILAAKHLVESLGASVAAAIFIFDCNGVPGYRETVLQNLGAMKRYAMISLTETNIGKPVN